MAGKLPPVVFLQKFRKKEAGFRPGKRYLTLFCMDLEQKAIERIRMASEMSLRLYGEPLVITDSGGKDSLVCREIAKRAGIRCWIRRPVYKGKPVTMWTLIPQKKFPPTRLQRYCCQVLKEESLKNRFITTGVRWAESMKRKNNRGIFKNYTADKAKKMILDNDNDEKRMLFESWAIKGKRICNPIIDWQDRDVWDYIRSERLPYNPLYEKGFFRVGCLGCPMAGKNRYREFRLYPTYKRAYIRAFEKMLYVIHQEGIPTKWKDAQGVFNWWMEEETLEGQIQLADFDSWREDNSDHLT